MPEAAVFARTAHMLSAMLLSGSIILNYYSGGKLDRHMSKHASNSTFQGVVGLGMFASGIANVLIIRDGRTFEDQVHKMWFHFFELKFILALLLTPAIYPLTSIFAPEGSVNITEATKSKVQFYIVVFVLFYSPFIKYFREEVCLNFERDIVMDKVQELQAKFDESSRKKDRPLQHEDDGKGDVVSDDGDETLDPTRLGKRAKQGKSQKQSQPAGQKKDGTKKDLEDQIRKMENIEQQMKWMEEQQQQFLGEKREGQRQINKVRTKEDARASLNSMPRTESLTEKVLKHRAGKPTSRTHEGQTGGTRQTTQADAEAAEIQRQLQQLREQEAALCQRLNSVAADKPKPAPEATNKRKQPIIDKQFAEQIRKDYGEEMLNELYGEEMPIDEDTLKEYGGEIIDEVEDMGGRLPGRPTEYRGRQVPEEEEQDDQDDQPSSTLDEFMRLQNQMASERVKKKQAK